MTLYYHPVSTHEMKTLSLVLQTRMWVLFDTTALRSLVSVDELRTAATVVLQGSWPEVEIEATIRACDAVDRHGQGTSVRWSLPCVVLPLQL